MMRNRFKESTKASKLEAIHDALKARKTKNHATARMEDYLQVQLGILIVRNV